MANLLEFYKSELASLPLMASVLATLSINVPASRMIRNPTYPDRNPSVYVYASNVRDYGSNESLDLLDVVCDWGGQSFDQGVALLAQLAGKTAPTKVEPRLRPRIAPPLAEIQKVDPDVYNRFAHDAEDAFRAQDSLGAQLAAQYLEARGLKTTPYLCGLGVIDHSVTNAPSSFRPGMICIPTWQNNHLKALKARNFEAEKAKRQYRNISGANVPPYNLEQALALDTDYLFVVEGEIDTLSVLEAYELDLAVIGIPGVGLWKRSLASSAIAGKKLFIALDNDEAGVKATHEILEWSRTNYVTAWAVDCGAGDKNEQLQTFGTTGFRNHIRSSVNAARVRESRRIQRALI